MSAENASSRPFPSSAAQSTGTNSPALIASLLAAWSLDEISNAEEFGAIKRYITNRGRADKEGKTTVGIAFWVYPTGLYGPFHKTDEGTIEKHGLLLTIERGARVDEEMQRVRAGFVTDGLEHIHIAAA